MAQHKKDAEFFSCKMDKATHQALTNLSEQTGLSKTVIVEKAVQEYCEKVRRTGKLSLLP